MGRPEGSWFRVACGFIPVFKGSERHALANTDNKLPPWSFTAVQSIKHVNVCRIPPHGIERGSVLLHALINM